MCSSSSNIDKMRQMLKRYQTVELKNAFLQEVSMSLLDYYGYDVAVNILLYSKEPGVMYSYHLQYNTLHKFKSAYGKYFRASPQSTSRILLGHLDDKD